MPPRAIDRLPGVLATLILLAGTASSSASPERGFPLIQILPADRGLLISVREEGLFLFQDALARPFAPEASRWTTENRVLQGCRLEDGRWVLGSLLGGILLLRPDGTVDQVIGSEEGLPDDFVTGIAVDREGSLWLSLNNGLARVEVRSPASVVDARSGLKGTVYAVVRHRGELWAGTSAGLFRAGTGEQTLRMRAVPGLPVGVWSFLSADEDLLAGTAFGIYLLRDGEPRLVEGTDPHTAYTLVASRADPGRVWAGTEDGLFSLRRVGSSWRYEGFVKGVPRGVRQIVESGGVLWCGTQIGGIVKVEMANGRSASEGPVVVRVPNSDDARPFRIGGKILVVQGDRLLGLDETRGTLVADPALAHLAIRGESDTSDLVARYGGEELAILLPDTDLRGALKVSEQVREGIEKLAIPHLAAPSGRITASVGVAVMAPEPGQRLEELVEAADLALYRAKRQGRNRVCAAERHDESQQRLPIEAVGS